MDSEINSEIDSEIDESITDKINFIDEQIDDIKEIILNPLKRQLQEAEIELENLKETKLGPLKRKLQEAEIEVENKTTHLKKQKTDLMLKLEHRDILDFIKLLQVMIESPEEKFFIGIKVIQAFKELWKDIFQEELDESYWHLNGNSEISAKFHVRPHVIGE